VQSRLVRDAAGLGALAVLVELLFASLQLVQVHDLARVRVDKVRRSLLVILYLVLVGLV